MNRERIPARDPIKTGLSKVYGRTNVLSIQDVERLTEHLPSLQGQMAEIAQSPVKIDPFFPPKNIQLSPAEIGALEQFFTDMTQTSHLSPEKAAVLHGILEEQKLRRQVVSSRRTFFVNVSIVSISTIIPAAGLIDSTHLITEHGQRVDRALKEVYAGKDAMPAPNVTDVSANTPEQLKMILEKERQEKTLREEIRNMLAERDLQENFDVRRIIINFVAMMLGGVGTMVSFVGLLLPSFDRLQEAKEDLRILRERNLQIIQEQPTSEKPSPPDEP